MTDDSIPSSDLEDPLNKSESFPMKSLLIPPAALTIVWLLMMSLPMARDIHSGGALVALGTILLVGIVGAIVELVAVPKAFVKIKRNKELRLAKSYFSLLIGTAHVVFVVGILIVAIIGLN